MVLRHPIEHINGQKGWRIPVHWHELTSHKCHFSWEDTPTNSATRPLAGESHSHRLRSSAHFGAGIRASAEEGGQAAARAGRKDLASVIAREQRQITTAGLVPVGLSRLPVSPGHSGPAARMPSCLTRAGRRPVVWPHEIPDSGISHRSAGSGPRSGTEAGDISPVFAALEHAAGDFTTLGTNLGHSNSPYSPVSGHAGTSPGRKLPPAPGRPAISFLPPPPRYGVCPG